MRLGKTSSRSVDLVLVAQWGVAMSPHTSQSNTPYALAHAALLAWGS